MKDEIKVNKANKSITFVNNGIAFSQFGVADEILDLITNLQEYNQIYSIDNKEVEEIINKNDKLKKYFINLKHEIIDVNKYRDEIEILRKENFKLKEDFKRHIDRINELTKRSDNLQEENKRLKEGEKQK